MSSNLALPPEIQAVVNTELAAGEQVAWSGQPLASRMARKGIILSLVGIPFTGFAVVWMGMALFIGHEFRESGAGFLSWIPSLFPLFGVPFLLIGLSMIFSPLWMARQARRTAYLVTERRAIILAPRFFGGVAVRSFMPSGLGDLQRTQNADGSGDIVFEREWRRGSNGRGRSVDVGFLAVPEVKRVEESIRALIDRVNRRP